MLQRGIGELQSGYQSRTDVMEVTDQCLYGVWLCDVGYKQLPVNNEHSECYVRETDIENGLKVTQFYCVPSLEWAHMGQVDFHHRHCLKIEHKPLNGKERIVGGGRAYTNNLAQRWSKCKG